MIRKATKVNQMVLALFATSLSADVTIRYKSEIKSSLPTLMQQSTAQFGNVFPADTTVRLKGSKSYSEFGGVGFISDTFSKELILLDSTGKKYATTTMDEYLQAMTAGLAGMLPEAAKAVMAAFRPNVESRSTGRTATIQGIEAEGREIVLSVEGPGLPNVPAGVMTRVVMQTWSSKESEASRVPAIREMTAYNQSASSTMRTVGGISKLLDMIPGVRDFASMMHDMAKPNSLLLRTHFDVFMPMMAAALKHMPAGTNSPGADFDPNGPLMQGNQEIVEFSTAAVPDSQFQVPEEYKQESIGEFVKGYLGRLIPAAR